MRKIRCYVGIIVLYVLLPWQSLQANTASMQHNIQHVSNVSVLVLLAAATGSTLAHKDSTGFLQFLGTNILDLGAFYGLKKAVHRERPNGADDESFPSGHTALAFGSANFLLVRYGWKYGIPAYMVAAFVGYGRVESRWHWTGDVLAGAAIGIGTSLIFTRPYNKKVKIIPFVGNNSAGISIISFF